VQQVIITYQRIKEEIAAIVEAEVMRMENTPELAGLIIS